MHKFEGKGKLASAINKARLNFSQVTQSGLIEYRDRSTGEWHSRPYSTLEDYYQATLVPLAEQDVLVMQPLEEDTDGDGNTIETLGLVLIHGESEQFYCANPVKLPSRELFFKGVISFKGMNPLQAWQTYLAYIRKLMFAFALCLSPSQEEDMPNLAEIPRGERSLPVAEPKPKPKQEQGNIANRQKAVNWAELYGLAIPEDIAELCKVNFNGRKVQFLSDAEMNNLQVAMKVLAEVRQKERVAEIEGELQKLMEFTGVEKTEVDDIRTKLFGNKPLASFSSDDVGRWIGAIEEIYKAKESAVQEDSGTDPVLIEA